MNRNFAKFPSILLQLLLKDRSEFLSRFGVFRTFKQQPDYLLDAY